MESYINNIKNELLDYVNKLRSEYLINKGQTKYEIKFTIANEIYNDFNVLNDKKSIIEYMNKLLEKSNSINKDYQKIYSDYLKETNNDKKRILIVRINELGAKLNAYNESYNIIYNNINKKIKPSKKEENVTPIKSKSIEPDKNEQVLNEDILISDKIIELLEKYYNLDSNSSEAKNILSQIYDLREKREDKFKNLFGDNYRVLITNLESIENMASMTPKEGFKPYELDSNAYIFELRNTINAINEYYFLEQLYIKKYYKSNSGISDIEKQNKYYKKYTNYLRKFHVLISSLFGSNNIEFSVLDSTISSNDLLSYLATCNLDGDYSVYKSKFENYKIGAEEADKKKYMESLTFLNKCINSLSNKAFEKLDGKIIKIIDKEIVFKDVIDERNRKLNEIYYSNMKNNKGMKL